MTEIIVNLFDQGIGLLVTAILFTSVLDAAAAANTINSRINEQQLIRMELQEYREVNQYIGKENLRAGDVIQFIRKAQGDPAVKVVIGSTYVYNDNTNITDYTATNLSKIVKNDRYYKCTFEEGMTPEGDGMYRDYFVFTAQ